MELHWLWKTEPILRIAEKIAPAEREDVSTMVEAKIVKVIGNQDVPVLQKSTGELIVEDIGSRYMANDYVAMPYTAVQDYYLVGLAAVLANPAVPDPAKGWSLFTHGQPAAPVFLVAFFPFWPAQVQSFDAKDVLFRSTTDCLIRFEGPTDVPHPVPANQWVRYRQIFKLIYVARSTANGTLTMRIEG